MASVSNDDHSSFFDDKISSILFAVGSAFVVATIYRLLSICFCSQHVFIITNQDHTTTTTTTRNQQAPIATPPPPAVLSHLIPTHKYEKKKKKKKNDLEDGDGDGDGDGDEEEDCTCVVCLGEFEEGEELKTLPECMHSFHVSCIDMWLHSHSSCPICRADQATPSSAHHHHDHQNIHIMQIAIVQDRLEPLS